MHHFCYASQSTSDKSNLLDDLTDILAEARDFNYRHDITGALYFADGYFFQCLEGKLEHLNGLFEKLSKDPRHENIKRFEMRPLEQINFAGWSMKYISRRDEIRDFCTNMGFNDFTPHSFEQAHVDALLTQLQTQDQEETTEN